MENLQEDCIRWREAKMERSKTLHLEVEEALRSEDAVNEIRKLRREEWWWVGGSTVLDVRAAVPADGSEVVAIKNARRLDKGSGIEWITTCTIQRFKTQEKHNSAPNQ
ncbi:hypothetical protein Pfo_025233 [Paulownia fortunei]|nr:hypothetical protein Pfo_025233 [Paulownia fortunei]